MNTFRFFCRPTLLGVHFLASDASFPKPAPPGLFLPLPFRDEPVPFESRCLHSRRRLFGPVFPFTSSKVFGACASKPRPGLPEQTDPSAFFETVPTMALVRGILSLFSSTL